MGKRESFGQIYMYTVLFIWFGAEVLFNSTIEKILVWKRTDLNEASAFFFLVLLMIQIVFFQKYQLKELALIALITIPFVLATLDSQYYRLISTWIFIVAAKYVNFEKVAKIAYYVELSMTLFVFYSFYFGMIEEYTFYRKSILRHSLGFTHPNQLGVRIFLLVVCRCYIKRRKFNVVDWLIIIASAVFVQRVSNSKTAFFALIILAILTLVHLILKRFDGGLEKLANAMIMVAVGCNIMSLTLSSINLNKYPLLKRFDYFMSRRFSCCNKVLNYYGIKLFGQDIKLVISKPVIGKYYHFWLDNAYMSLLLRYGPIVLILFSALYIATMLILKNMKEYMLIEILCLYAIYGMMENNFFSLSQNMFLLLLSYPLYRNVGTREEHSGILGRVRISL